MRHIPIGLGLGALAVLVGCNQFQAYRGTTPPPGPVARVPATTPTATQLVEYLNKNAGRIQTLDCGDLDLDAKQGHQPVSLRGWMVCQKPRSFRMGAKVLGKQELDMGSNDNEFWYWIGKNEPPYLFHCSYPDMQAGKARMPFPFQPEWLMEAMGMSEYAPAVREDGSQRYQVKATPSSLELIEESRSPQGAPIRKVTVFNRGEAQGNVPQVTAHILQDGNGKEICGAYITEVQGDPRGSGAVIPHKVRLSWPAERIELKMKLDGLTVNAALPPQRQQTLFSRPQMRNVQTYDLARGLDNPAGRVQRAGGIVR